MIKPWGNSRRHRTEGPGDGGVCERVTCRHDSYEAVSARRSQAKGTEPRLFKHAAAAFDRRACPVTGGLFRMGKHPDTLVPAHQSAPGAGYGWGRQQVT